VYIRVYTTVIIFADHSTASHFLLLSETAAA